MMKQVRHHDEELDQHHGRIGNVYPLLSVTYCGSKIHLSPFHDDLVYRSILTRHTNVQNNFHFLAKIRRLMNGLLNVM